MLRFTPVWSEGGFAIEGLYGTYFFSHDRMYGLPPIKSNTPSHCMFRVRHSYSVQCP